MIDHRNVADLIKVNGKYQLSFFNPSNAAYLYDDKEGKRGILYAIQCEEFCKLGMTTNFEKRFRGIDYGVPFPINLVGKKTVPLCALSYAEAWMHKKHADRAVKIEWFRLSPEEAAMTLSEASIVARLYCKLCAAWYREDKARKAADPIYQRRVRKEYEEHRADMRRRIPLKELPRLPPLMEFELE